MMLISILLPHRQCRPTHCLLTNLSSFAATTVKSASPSFRATRNDSQMPISTSTKYEQHRQAQRVKNTPHTHPHTQLHHYTSKPHTLQQTFCLVVVSNTNGDVVEQPSTRQVECVKIRTGRRIVWIFIKQSNARHRRSQQARHWPCTTHNHRATFKDKPVK